MLYLHLMKLPSVRRFLANEACSALDTLARQGMDAASPRWLCGLTIDVAVAKRHDIVDCAGTSFVRFNNDSGHSRTHFGRDRIYKVGIQRSHYGIAGKPCGGAQSRSQRDARRPRYQTDQRSGSGTNRCSEERAVASL